MAKQLIYTLSDEDYDLHKERILRRRASIYEAYLEQYELEDTEANKNAFCRDMGKAQIDKFLTRLIQEDISEQLQANIPETGLS